MGRLLSKLPTDVHLGKFLLIACVFGCLDPALTIAAALNSKSPFLTPFGKEQEAQRQKLTFKIGEHRLRLLVILCLELYWQKTRTSLRCITPSPAGEELARMARTRRESSVERRS